MTTDFHHGMKSQVKYKGMLNEPSQMRTGVRQGAVEAPTLWDPYYHFVVQDRETRLSEKLGRPGGCVVARNPTIDLACIRAKIRSQAKIQKTNIPFTMQK